MLFVMSGSVFAQWLKYDSHVIFDNSLSDNFYYYSSGTTTAPSKLELIDGKCPVDANNYKLAPNSLRMHWNSQPGGDWKLSIQVSKWRNRDINFDGTVLFFWMYSNGELNRSQLPSVSMTDMDKNRSGRIELRDFSQSVPSKKWTQVIIPLEAFKPANKAFNLHKIKLITFHQSDNDGADHTLLLDEIKIYTPDVKQTAPSGRPVGLKADGYEKHVELKWQGSKDTSIERYVIYRSYDGKTFKQVGSQRAGVDIYEDYVGVTGKSFFYKVCAMSQDYVESQFSGIASATTHQMTDGELLDMVQRATFRYFWDNAHPVSGLARENTPGDDNLVTIGASGFGVMSLLVGVERGFVTRDQGTDRMLKILHFLKKADRFHGAWPHFLDGQTGKVIPLFGKYDDGADLVETSFMMQGLLAARAFFDKQNPKEEEIRSTITDLWQSVEWDWFRQDSTSDFLFWHWSPDFGWHINHPLVGWNETMIVYLLAIASPTHPVPASMYYTGWAGQSKRAVDYRKNWSQTEEGDHYANGHEYYGIKLDVGCGPGGPLFFTHYSFLGFDPRGIKDKFTDYFENNRNQSLINRSYCIANPGHYVGYSEDCWGLTASDDPWGYLAHSPDLRTDNGTITPTGAISSMPYTPKESMATLKYLYNELGGKLWGVYGFRDAFNLTQNWYADIYMALDEGPIVVMIENYRTGLLWKLFMSNPEIGEALKKIGFVEDKRSK